MKQIILRKSILLALFTTAIFIVLGLVLIFFNLDRPGYMARRGEVTGVVLILIFSIKFFLDLLLYKGRYIRINSSGIYDHSSILFSGMYHWNKIIDLDVTQTSLKIREGHSHWKVNGLSITQDNMKMIKNYRDKYMN